jgi:hypothetical protein
MRPICRNCEYFDCKGRDPIALEITYRGDCLNRKAPWFQSGPDETCSHFFPDSIRWPGSALSRPQCGGGE